jgi:hypothetical protein
MGRHALLIGVDRFDDKRLNPLNAPAKDVEALGEVLGSSRRGQFEVTTSLNDDFLTIRDYLSALYDERHPDDTLLLYYTGHGISDDRSDDLFFTTPQSNMDRPWTRGMSAAELRKIMQKSRARKQIVLLDCCHSGLFLEGTKGSTDRPVITDGTFDTRVTGRYVITATNKWQPAKDGVPADNGNSTSDRLSLFTSWLVAGLKGAASPNDHSVTMDALFSYICDQANSDVSHPAPNNFCIRSSGDIVIAQNPSVKPIDSICSTMVGVANQLRKLAYEAEVQETLNSATGLISPTMLGYLMGPEARQSNQKTTVQLDEIHTVIRGVLDSVESLLKLKRERENVSAADSFSWLRDGFQSTRSYADIDRLPMGKDVTDDVFNSMGTSLLSAEGRLASLSQLLESGGDVSNADMLRIQQATAQVTLCTQSMTALIESKKECGKAIARNL